MAGLGWLLLLLLLFSGPLHAQTSEGTPLTVAKTARHSKDSAIDRPGVPQKDITDELHFLFPHKKKSDSVQEIHKLTISFLPAVGYTLTTRAAITGTGNGAFRIDPSSRISTVTTSANYTENKQFSVPLETNIWTKGNKFNFVGDIHFMKYPQASFGLGSNSWIGNVDSMQYNYIRFYEIVYRRITNDFYVGGGYIIDWRYDITSVNTKAPIPSDYELYGPQTHSTSTGFTLNALYDTRDNLTVPTQGMEWVAYGGVASRGGAFNDSLYSEAGTDGRVFWTVASGTVLATHMSLRYLPTAHAVPFWALSFEELEASATEDELAA